MARKTKRQIEEEKAAAAAAEAEEAEEDEEGVRIRPNLENYETTRSFSGKPTKVRKDDDVAQALIGFSLEQVYEVADALSVEIPNYDHLNPGMQRMCIGNKIRGWINQTEKANEALVADGKKPSPDPLVSLEKVCKPIRVANEKEAKAAAKGKDAA